MEAFRVACPEEDLACPGEWLARRPSQVMRLFQLLRIMFVKTEVTLVYQFVVALVVAQTEMSPVSLRFVDAQRGRRSIPLCGIHSIP